MSLFSTLNSTSNTLATFERALSVTQNNVSNASTPGYVRQKATFEALPFNDGTGQLGGVTAGPNQSTRDQYAEQTVQYANSQLGTSEQQVQSLTDLQNQFDISGSSGVPAALSSLYSAFSTWSNNPNDATSRQGVLTAAGTLASAFQQTSANVAKVASNTTGQIGSLVGQINTLAGKIAGYNAQMQQGDPNDPGVDASINSTLQDLSELANVTTSRNSNGTVNVTLGGGQVELVNGSTVEPLSSSASTANSTIVIGGSAVGIPISISAGKNDTLNLNIDGSGVPRITLSPTDTTPAAVVSDINAQLAAYGSAATASLDGIGRLVITSWSGSPNAAVKVLPGSANSALGLITAAPSTASIKDSNGTDITADITQGKLAGALSVMNQTLPAIQGNSSQTGSLNQLATTLADRVNSLMGVDLFTYDNTNAVNTARSLQLNLNLTAGNLPSPQVTTLTGTATTGALTIATGVNDQLNLQVDGKTYPAITLNPLDTSNSAVASDLNSQFASLGIGAHASTNANTGALILSTMGAGNNASIQVLSGSANTTVGLNSTTPAYASVATLTGSAAAGPLSIVTGVNDQVNLQIGGKTYPAITLNPSDTTLSAVASDLNSQFATLGINAGASTNSAGALVISTTGAGASASIQLLGGSANTTIGLNSPTSTHTNNVNGIALSLANLENPQNSADEIGGQSYTAYFGGIAAGVGSSLSTATANQSTQQDVFDQTVALRQQVSGVDLNTEAAQIVQLQSSYTAAAKMVTVIDDMIQTVLGLIPTS